MPTSPPSAPTRWRTSCALDTVDVAVSFVFVFFCFVCLFVCCCFCFVLFLFFLLVVFFTLICDKLYPEVFSIGSLISSSSGKSFFFFFNRKVALSGACGGREGG